MVNSWRPHIGHGQYTPVLGLIEHGGGWGGALVGAFLEAVLRAAVGDWMLR